MSALVSKRAIRILDFDIENRPLSYWYADRPTAEVTAIGAAHSSNPNDVWVYLLGRDNPITGLKVFAELYRQADIVTGHYIRKHDLRILNGAMLEYGLPPLGPKLTIDTKLDLVTQGDLPATQEHLAEMFGVGHKKEHMTQMQWREANRLTPSGLREAERRVKGDVMQHMALRTILAEKGLLGSPKVWRP